MNCHHHAYWHWRSYFCIAVLSISLTCHDAHAIEKIRDIILSAVESEGQVTPEVIIKKMNPVDALKVAELRLAMADRNPGVRRVAIETLSFLGDRPFKGFMLCLSDQDKGVITAAETALILIGPYALQHLMDMSAKEPCPSKARASVARVLGEIEHPGGIPALVKDLIACREGGFPLDVAFDALARIGTPSILPLVDIARYRVLRGRAYTILLRFKSTTVEGVLKAILADSGIDVQQRMYYAEQANILLGTAIMKDTLVSFYRSLTNEATLPVATTNDAKDILSKLQDHASNFNKEPLTVQFIKAEYGDEALVKSYEAEARELKTNEEELEKRRIESARRDEQLNLNPGHDNRKKKTYDPRCFDWEKKRRSECKFYLTMEERIKIDSGFTILTNTKEYTDCIKNEECPYK